MDAVEFHQRMAVSIADGIVQQDDLATRAGIDQISQDKLSNPAEAVKSDTGHEDQAFACASVPIESTRDWRDIRLSDSNGSSTKVMIRRRNAA